MDVKNQLQAFSKYVVDAVRSPRQELDRRQHQLRNAWDMGLYCWRQLVRHRAEGMAAELTYRTIFSLIPVVVLGLVMFRIFGGLESVQVRVENQLYTFFGVPTIPEDFDSRGKERGTADPIEEIVDPDDPIVADVFDLASEKLEDAVEDDPLQPEEPNLTERLIDKVEKVNEAAEVIRRTEKTQESPEPDDPREVVEVPEVSVDGAEADAIRDTETDIKARANIRDSLHSLTTKIASLDFASIGVVGLLLFIYAAVALADSTEYLFNRIYDAPGSRPIHIRVAIHWAIITLGSGLLAMSLYMSAQVVEYVGTFGTGSTLKIFLQHLLSALASWVLLFLLYALMPNTHVSVRAAGIGSFVGAALWEVAKFGFQIYVSKLVPYAALYGSLGLIPLFLFWIYVTWLIVLFGLILTNTLQTVRGNGLRNIATDDDRAVAGDPDWTLPMMIEVARSFENGHTIDRQKLADRLGLSSRIVHSLEPPLIEANCLRRIAGPAGEQDALTLARPASRIRVAEILGVAHSLHQPNGRSAWTQLQRLNEAQRAAAGDTTLGSMLEDDAT